MQSLHLTANRLRHHLLEWGGGERVVLLLHGFLEHAHVWELVGPRLAAAGLHVYALDWRGHGDSEWIGAGGYYHFADYVADLDAVVRQLGGRAALVAHSMGGNAALLYAGTAPSRVTRLVSIEGLGPADCDVGEAPERYAHWPARPPAGGGARARDVHAPGRARASARAPSAHGRPRPWGCSPRTARAPRAARGRGVRPAAPDALAAVLRRPARGFWQRVACPVLYVEGDASFLRLPDDELASRLAELRATRAVIRGSAHHPHLERRAGALADFDALARCRRGW
ncbi:MAG: alpha/beta hydrolase [Candidatus Binatia bacterium]